jgi:hypothetical protein
MPAVMTVERHDGNQLPKEVLGESATRLFLKALDVLRYNKGFESAKIDAFLDDPQGHEIQHKPGRVTFESNGTKYDSILRRDIWRDEIRIQTENQGVEETASIILMYDHSTHNYRAVRGGLHEAEIVFAKRFRMGENTSPVYVNNSEAAQKVSDFLRRI